MLTGYAVPSACAIPCIPVHSASLLKGARGSRRNRGGRAFGRAGRVGAEPEPVSELRCADPLSESKF